VLSDIKRSREDGREDFDGVGQFLKFLSLLVFIWPLAGRIGHVYHIGDFVLLDDLFDRRHICQIWQLNAAKNVSYRQKSILPASDGSVEAVDVAGVQPEVEPPAEEKGEGISPRPVNQNLLWLHYLF